jgi:hypothetical protein
MFVLLVKGMCTVFLVELRYLSLPLVSDKGKGPTDKKRLWNLKAHTKESAEDKVCQGEASDGST